VADLDAGPAEAVVQGLGADVTWTELAAVGHLAEAGVPWVATNVDLTLPTPSGRAPGNGALVALVRTATSATPHVVGKPRAALFELARDRLGTGRPGTLVCGDLLGTDIEGANAAGLDSLFVLSGSSRLRDLIFAEPAARPTYVAGDLSGLLEPLLPLRDAVLRDVGDRAESLRSVVASAWAARDAGGEVSSDAGLWDGIERRLVPPR
ncbi:HAD hydrolase-like protein, partial [Amycolatopsis sp. SID8362]|uniref:HAD-IIA family hydrolase n=1 Tax=Amycolatopsis sp. SID8362 TaxID=2690346 RepID=UPI001368FE72